MKRDGRTEGKRDERNEDEKEDEDEEENQQTQSGPGAGSESKTDAETAPAGPQPLIRSQCEQAGRTWNEGTNTCN